MGGFLFYHKNPYVFLCQASFAKHVVLAWASMHCIGLAWTCYVLQKVCFGVGLPSPWGMACTTQFWMPSLVLATLELWATHTLTHKSCVGQGLLLPRAFSSIRSMCLFESQAVWVSAWPNCAWPPLRVGASKLQRHGQLNGANAEIWLPITLLGGVSCAPVCCCHGNSGKAWLMWRCALWLQGAPCLYFWLTYLLAPARRKFFVLST